MQLIELQSVYDDRKAKPTEHCVSDQITEWLTAAIAGDDEAFTHIVDMYQTNIYNLCYRMLGTPQEAEDAAQEAFWRAYQSIKKYDPKRSFITWLLSIAAHYCIDQQRKRKFLSFSIDTLLEDNLPSTLPDPESIINQTEKEKYIQNMLSGLTSKDRAIVIMRYWYEFSENEIAENLSISTSAVKSRLHRARKTLAHKWHDHNGQNLHTERIQNETSTI